MKQTVMLLTVLLIVSKSFSAAPDLPLVQLHDTKEMTEFFEKQLDDFLVFDHIEFDDAGNEHIRDSLRKFILSNLQKMKVDDRNMMMSSNLYRSDKITRIELMHKQTHVGVVTIFDDSVYTLQFIHNNKRYNTAIR
ncbi:MULTISPECIES: hypothetical protein [unclassified Lentimonas]|uniref:hypothetical protein n=1 Tax=unclassified Lentimonas TaxID=2630993 RepID=UPI00138A4F4E|nr:MULTISPECIES: hypothetical protein [unclassified Lentimonas]